MIDFDTFLKGFRRVLEGVLKGPSANPSETPSETPSESLLKSGGSVAENESLEHRQTNGSEIGKWPKNRIVGHFSLFVGFSSVRFRCTQVSTKYHGCGFFAYSWKLPAYSGSF